MMTNLQDIEALLVTIFASDALILVTLSESRKGEEISKVVIRPILVKGRISYQLTEHHQKQALHHNLPKEDCLNWLIRHIDHFKQTFVYTTSADYHLLVGKKGNFTLLKKTPTKIQSHLLHNRQKEYLWQEGQPIPFLVHLGVMNQQGKVYAAKKDKFRQINRFLEMIHDALPALDSSRILRIVDFGCGKAYLTFALYHFLKLTKGYQVDMVGLDLKADVIHHCQELAQALGYQQDLHFIREDINQYQTKERVDMVVSLHACDTATDAALEKAIRWQAQVILCVPCCQHELMPQIHQETLRPLLKYGILKERFAALTTDAARAQLLEVLGYRTQILEFIELENTPKNLLIRAIRCSHPREHQKVAWQTYLNFKETLHINPSLERRFQSELNRMNLSRDCN
jgi:SAM-dependent methyltransferase